MHATSYLSALAIFLPSIMALALTPRDAATHLNVTAIGTLNGASRWECWEIASPFIPIQPAGGQGTVNLVELGGVANITYHVIPAGLEIDYAPAANNQWVVALQGIGIISLDGVNTTFPLQSGENSLVFATDTPATSPLGHSATFPGMTETIWLHIPTLDGKIPEHRVLWVDAPCKASEYQQQRKWAISP